MTVAMPPCRSSGVSTMNSLASAGTTRPSTPAAMQKSTSARKESSSTTCSTLAPRKGICSTGRMPCNAGWSIMQRAHPSPSMVLRCRCGLLCGPLLVLLEEQAVGLTPLVSHVLGKGRRVLGRFDLSGDQLHLCRVEAIEGDIERHIVLDLGGRVLCCPVEDLTHQRIGNRLRVEAVIRRWDTRRVVIGGELLRRVQERDEIGRDRFLIVTRPRRHRQSLRSRAELILERALPSRRQLHHAGVVLADRVDVRRQLRAGDEGEPCFALVNEVLTRVHVQ